MPTCIACDGHMYKYTGPTATPKCPECHSWLQNVQIGKDSWRCANCKHTWNPTLCFFCKGKGTLTRQEEKDVFSAYEHAVNQAKGRLPDYSWQHNSPSEAVWALGEAYKGVTQACGDLHEHLRILIDIIHKQKQYGGEFHNCAEAILREYENAKPS